jgi:hypothetical protein
MTTTDLIIICLTILGLLTPIIIFIIRKNFYGPKLKIEIRFTRGMETPQGYSGKVFTPDGYIDSDRSISHWEQTWNYDITIYNNSQVTAYNTFLNIVFSPLQFTQLENLNHFEPIKSDSNKSLLGEIKYRYDAIKNQRRQFKAIPSELNGLKIFLSYENEWGSKYYSLYTLTEGIQKNETFYFKPRISKRKK